MSGFVTNTTPRRISIEDYLRMEEVSETKHEYRDGEIIDMSGETADHAGIAMQLGRHLLNKLEGAGCRVFGSDLSVRPSNKARYYYPDLSVVCGPVEYDPAAGRRTVVNPLIVVEVLSETTQSRDRGEKFDAYRSIRTFREYVIVSQTEPRLEAYYRQDDGTWLFNPASGLDATFRFRSVAVEVRLADVYAGVVFPPIEDPQKTPESQPPVE